MPLTENSAVNGASLKKKLKFSIGILTFLAISNEFWKGTASVGRSVSQLSHKMGQIWLIKIRAQFLCLSKICEICGYFRHQIMLNHMIRYNYS